MANLGPAGWNRGRIRRLSVRDSNEREAAYEIEIEPGGRVAYAPHDHDQVVRRPTTEEASAPPKLRFKKGDRVHSSPTWAPAASSPTPLTHASSSGGRRRMHRRGSPTSP